MSIGSTKSIGSTPSTRKPLQRGCAALTATLEKRNHKPVDARETICYNHTPLTKEALLKQNGADLDRKKALTEETVFVIKFDSAAQLFATE